MSHQHQPRPLPLAGPLTAHEAWEAALPLIRELDPAFRLTHIHSGTDFSSDGRSKAWGFTIRLASGARAAVDVGPCPDWDRESLQMPMCIAHRQWPAPDPQRRDQLLRTEPTLPTPFRDTPEAARAFAAQGVDLDAGPSDMMVQSALDVAGEFVWLTHYWDHAPFTTPFTDDR